MSRKAKKTEATRATRVSSLELKVGDERKTINLPPRMIEYEICCARCERRVPISHFCIFAGVAIVLFGVCRICQRATRSQFFIADLKPDYDDAVFLQTLRVEPLDGDLN
jgi:hypothetical protein